MDRNIDLVAEPRGWKVATREGGVDRNVGAGAEETACDGSPPARVAWIETFRPASWWDSGAVATREGGVDRNTKGVLL